MLIGHEQLTADFKRLADHKRLAHGYIFFGLPRIGKATFAHALANYLETGVFDWIADAPPPLGDVLRIAAAGEKRSIGIDDAHAVRSFLIQAPNRSPLRTAIIENAEFLTTDAENALLKITEEPGLRSLIILVIDDPERLLPTLRSRLQKIYFPPVPTKAIASWLETSTGLSSSVAEKIARGSGGAPGLAQALLQNEKLRNVQRAAHEFLKRSGKMRSDFVKEMVADESGMFNFGAFLEALGRELFPDAAAARARIALWHRFMDLRRSENSYNLNPRLQLMALAQYL